MMSVPATHMGHCQPLGIHAQLAVALEEFIERHRNRNLLDKINKAYDEKPDNAERKYLKKMRQRHRKMVDGQW